MSRWKGSKGVTLENCPKTFSRRAKSIPDIFWGWWDAPLPPLEPLDFAQNTLFLAISNGSRGEKTKSIIFMNGGVLFCQFLLFHRYLKAIITILGILIYLHLLVQYIITLRELKTKT